jgi:hypothetical protein
MKKLMTAVFVLGVLVSCLFMSCGKSTQGTEQPLMVASTEVPASLDPVGFLDWSWGKTI